MITTTTNTVQNKEISEYLGVVTGEVIFGTHAGKDILAGLTDFFGGRSGAYERSVREARNKALEEMQQYAEELKADAIVGVDFDYETIRQGMIMVNVSGTAVKLK